MGDKSDTPNTQLVAGHKPYRLVYEDINKGDIRPVLDWANQLFTWLKIVNKDVIFDFRRSKWSWLPTKSRGGGLGRFTHPQNLQELENQTDHEKWPYYIQEDGNPISPGKIEFKSEKTETPDESIDSDEESLSGSQESAKLHVSWMVDRKDDQKIENPIKAREALLDTLTAYTGDRSIAEAAATKYEINVANPHEIFTKFLAAFENHLRLGSQQIQFYLPDVYSFGMTKALWPDSDSMMKIQIE